ncbi:hypothetical protein [Dactylosporangium sp. CS-033363]|uniref:hypothetical protein n=1 Tax=Dactylosporangium sp. CS-033363 TaxID=3239935 RepID=UPI003D8C1682
MDSTVPMLLLDLDGVLNPFGAAACPDGYQERVFFEGEEPGRYCPQHAAWIRELADAGELWWPTAWMAVGGRARGAATSTVCSRGVAR